MLVIICCFITFIYCYLSVWYMMLFFIFPHQRTQWQFTSELCLPTVADQWRQHLIKSSLSLSSNLSPSPWWQAKLWSATNASSASGTCASPAKPHVTPDSTATAVLGKQVRRPGIQKSHHATFWTGTGLQYTSTPTANKKTAARFVKLQIQQFSVFHRQHY